MMNLNLWEERATKPNRRTRCTHKHSNVHKQNSRNIQQKTNKTIKESMHNNSYRGRYRRWREALLKNKTISEEDDAFLSGYQKWMCTLQTRGVIATPNCYLIIQSLYTVPVILQVVQFLYLPGFLTFLRLNQRRMKWPSFLLGGTFEKKRPTKFSMHKKKRGCKTEYREKIIQVPVMLSNKGPRGQLCIP